MTVLRGKDILQELDSFYYTARVPTLVRMEGGQLPDPGWRTPGDFGMAAGEDRGLSGI